MLDKEGAYGNEHMQGVPGAQPINNLKLY